MAKCRRCRADVEDEPEHLWRTYEVARQDPGSWFSLWQDIDRLIATEEGVTIQLLESAMEDDRKAAKPKAAAKVTDAELAAVVPNWQPQPLLSAPKPTLWQKMKALWQ